MALADRMRLVVLALIVWGWHYWMVDEFMAGLTGHLQVAAFSALLAMLALVSWCYGAWFQVVAEARSTRGLSYGVFRAIQPVVPLYVFGLPLLGPGVFSARFVVCAALLWGLCRRPGRVYRLIWQRRFHFAEAFPASGVIEDEEYRKFKRLVAVLLVGVPVAGLVLHRSAANLV